MGLIAKHQVFRNDFEFFNHLSLNYCNATSGFRNYSSNQVSPSIIFPSILLIENQPIDFSTYLHYQHIVTVPFFILASTIPISIITLPRKPRWSFPMYLRSASFCRHLWSCRKQFISKSSFNIDSILLFYHYKRSHYNNYIQMLETLKEQVNQGKVQIARMGQDSQPNKVEFGELEGAVQRQEKYGSIYKSIECLNWQEKYQWVNFRRLRANQIYRNGDVDTAIEEYIVSLIGLDLSDKENGHYDKMQNQLKFPILLNMATCFFKKRELERALQLCDSVLSQAPNFTNALYKKSYLLMEKGNYPESKQNIRKGFEIAKKQQNKKMLKEFEELNKTMIKKSQQNREVYSRIFNPQSELDQETDTLLKKQEEEDESQILYLRDSLFEKLKQCCMDCLGYLAPRSLLRVRRKKRL